MPADPRLLELMSYYRDAELHGAALLMRLMRMMHDDADAQIKLTLHVAQETRHAWLWTKRMMQLGGAPLDIAAGYQTRIGMRTVPRTVADLLALTIVAEGRSLARYDEHAARPDVDEATRKVLHAVRADEHWHLAWMQTKLDDIASRNAAVRHRVATLMQRYREIDRQVYDELRAREQAVFGA